MLGRIVLGDSAHDGPFLQPVVDEELQEFVHLLHLLAFQHCAYPDVQLLEVFECDDRLDGVGLGISRLVGTDGGGQLVELNLYDVVFDFLEEQRRLGQLLAWLEQFVASEVVPSEILHVDHSAQLL